MKFKSVKSVESVESVGSVAEEGIIISIKGITRQNIKQRG